MNWQDKDRAENSAEIIYRSGQPSAKPTALGGCIFAGGFSLGMEEAGFNVLGHIELEGLELGSHTSQQRWPVHLSKLEGWQALLDSIDAPDVMYFNPPCVAYAGTGKHMGTGDERMCYVRHSAYDAALRKQPKVWAWELVPGVFSKDLPWLQAMAFRAAKLGYECHAFLTSSALHGGYQDRRRFHFVASRMKIDFEASYASCSPEWKGVRTLGDALNSIEEARFQAWRSRRSNRTIFDHREFVETVPKLGLLPNDQTVYTGAFQTLFPHAAPGMHLGHIPDEILRQVYRPRGTAWSGTGRPGFAHTRGRTDRPSPNVLGGHTIVHPTEDRYLTPRECAAIMGFPMDYAFSHGAKAYAEIGRGLCTHNARFLGKVIMDALINDQPAIVQRYGPLHVVDWRGRARTNSLAMPEAEAKAWYLSRHGTEAPKLYGTRVVADEVEEESEDVA